jgi:hypothetical protein
MPKNGLQTKGRTPAYSIKHYYYTTGLINASSVIHPDGLYIQNTHFFHRDHAQRGGAKGGSTALRQLAKKSLLQTLRRIITRR